jgi:hypothetical protein
MVQANAKAKRNPLPPLGGGGSSFHSSGISLAGFGVKIQYAFLNFEF